jgi:hypothetical protein
MRGEKAREDTRPGTSKALRTALRGGGCGEDWQLRLHHPTSVPPVSGLLVGRAAWGQAGAVAMTGVPSHCCSRRSVATTERHSNGVEQRPIQPQRRGGDGTYVRVPVGRSPRSAAGSGARRWSGNSSVSRSTSSPVGGGDGQCPSSDPASPRSTAWPTRSRSTSLVMRLDPKLTNRRTREGDKTGDL